eukprot:752356-Hanusia_phi.AAC.1
MGSIPNRTQPRLTQQMPNLATHCQRPSPECRRVQRLAPLAQSQEFNFPGLLRGRASLNG